MNEKHSIYSLAITTPDGVIDVPIQHRVSNENDDNMQTTIIVTIQGHEMRFDGETTEEVLIKFAKSLPVGWCVKACLSCRYGHFCPVGNYDNELFCVTEFEPKEISDLWHVTENNEERRKRSRNMFHRCDQYMAQTNDYFTYNAYYSEINPTNRMINISEKLYLKTKSIMDTWCEDDIYAISFLVYSNESFEYKGFNNVSYFAISYNTEDDCKGAGQFDEKRWNYAFWRQNEIPVIDPNEPNELIDSLFDWYKENGISNIGEEDVDCYDENCKYIGKGPVGHYELLTLITEVAKRLQQERFMENKFGKILPIIIHGLEYAWYDIEATLNANINGEADMFLKAMKNSESLKFC